MPLNTTLYLILVLLLLWLNLTLAVNKPQWVPTYHLAPEKGWMNKPNGLIFFDRYSHVFYQYNPNDTKWGPMHWGHAKSSNMLSWEILPVALAPSLPEDIDGIFSGSAVVNNGNLTLIYTGVSGNYSHQIQCLATSSDGLSFLKEGAVLYRDGDDKDFRDPKLWWQDDSWFVLIGSTNVVSGKDRGVLLLYKSPDLYSWDYQGIFAQANEKQGYMWESPDLFTLGNKQILLVSPQGMEQDGYDYENLFQSGYFTGTWSPGTEYKIEKQFRELDHGHDFYAPQTLTVPDGRTILIGRMAMWDSIFPESDMSWAGMFTLPRELSLSSFGDLELRPLREIRMRRTKSFNTEKSRFVLTSTSITLEDDVTSNEIVVGFDLSATTSEYFGLRIGDKELSSAGLKLYVNSTLSRLFLERYYPQYDIAASSRSIPIAANGTLTLDIFFDMSSIEIFVNDGQAVISSRIYPNDGERGLTFFCEGGTMIVNRYEYWYM